MNTKRDITLINRIVLLDGITGTGKTMFLALLNSSSNTMAGQFLYAFEHISILHKMNKRIIQSISYYKLIERLKFKSIINNNNLIIKEEWYTSKTCTLCGNKKEDLGGNKIYSCVKCNLTTNRDYNGCRNIFLSCIKSIN